MRWVNCLHELKKAIMSTNQKNKGSKIFIIAFFVFLIVMILIVIDMASRTTAPWNRNKETPADTIVQESPSVSRPQ